MFLLIALIMLMALFVFSDTRAEGYHTASSLPYLEGRVDSSPSDPFPSSSRLSAGKFLVAGRNIKDPRFSETVILLVQYGLDGAMGIVINRPTDVKLTDAFPEIEELRKSKNPVYYGGPVSFDQIKVLFQSGRSLEDSRGVFEDVFITASQQVFHGLITEPVSNERFRVYAGYAGWAPGQLDKEVLKGDWYVLPAGAETVFREDVSGIWPELILRISTQFWVDNPDVLREKGAG